MTPAEDQMRLLRGVRVALVLAGLCAYVSAHGAAAPEESTYPTKPVRLIVPFAPGGTNDILGRMIANHLSARLGRTFIVDNRPGADGAIGTEYVMKANPDGYTLIVLSSAYAMNPAVRKLPYDPQTAVEFIIGLGSGPTVLSVGPSLQVDSAKALFAVAKSKPGQVIFSTSGGFQYFATALLQTLSGQQFNIVLYKGTAPGPDRCHRRSDARDRRAHPAVPTAFQERQAQATRDGDVEAQRYALGFADVGRARREGFRCIQLVHDCRHTRDPESDRRQVVYGNRRLHAVPGDAEILDQHGRRSGGEVDPGSAQVRPR
jgi:hypothetical protein